MIDHITVLVRNYDASKAFYLAALRPLGYELVMEFTREQIPDLPFERSGGFGAGGKPDLWLRPAESVAPTHIAFASPDRATVDAFHTAALGAGGTDHGAPGLRPQYHPNYYGAFVLDPDGYNVEVVCHTPA
ncbi:MAG: VOC family protein [Myxococcales bacterium]|nr:VOC family protein [Myxococcales bacterium]MDD9971334.1 VOC family protein [Myxococcales bacterium]